MVGKLKWWEAVEIIGVTDRTMRRWRKQYEEHGYGGLSDGRVVSVPIRGVLPHLLLVSTRFL
jgi:transposase-like protein